jgi:hypothetical protein
MAQTFRLGTMPIEHQACAKLATPLHLMKSVGTEICPETKMPGCGGTRAFP